MADRLARSHLPTFALRGASVAAAAVVALFAPEAAANTGTPIDQAVDSTITLAEGLGGALCAAGAAAAVCGAGIAGASDIVEQIIPGGAAAFSLTDLARGPATHCADWLSLFAAALGVG